jgi:hypothetical protein
MKKVLLTLAVVVMAVLIVMAMTKPDRTAHYDALKGVVLKTVVAKIDKVGEAIPFESLRTKGTYIALNAADEYLKNNLLVYEKTFYNKGVLVYEDYFILVSIGVMGHVFLTFDEKDLEKLTERVDVLKLIENEDLKQLIK